MRRLQAAIESQWPGAAAGGRPAGLERHWPRRHRDHARQHRASPHFLGDWLAPRARGRGAGTRLHGEGAGPATVATVRRGGRSGGSRGCLHAARGRGRWLGGALRYGSFDHATAHEGCWQGKALMLGRQDGPRSPVTRAVRPSAADRHGGAGHRAALQTDTKAAFERTGRRGRVRRSAPATGCGTSSPPKAQKHNPWQSPVEPTVTASCCQPRLHAHLFAAASATTCPST